MNEALRILIVEDNPGDVDLMKELFPDAGPIRYEFESVSRLAEAVALAGRDSPDGSRFDVALVDLGLPDSQGMDTYHALREAAPGMAIVVLTGNVDEELALEAVRSGAQDFIVKGWLSGESLLRAVRYAVERKRTEERLQKALTENRTLLKELQHRAKNSFALILSMISIMPADVFPPKAREAMAELAARVRSVSELYTLLYASGAFWELRLDQYLDRVAASLTGLSTSVELRTSFQAIDVPARDATPMGLILTELVTNAVKYAYPGGRRGAVVASLRGDRSSAVLEVEDDGVGLKPGFDLDRDAGMGLGIAKGLADEMGGSLSLKAGGPGTRWAVEFRPHREGGS